MQIPGLQCDQINQSCPHLIFEGMYNEVHHWKTHLSDSGSPTTMLQTQNHDNSNASNVLMIPYDLKGQMHKCYRLSDYQGIIRAWNGNLVYHVTISTWHYGYNNSSVSIMGSVMMHIPSLCFICIDCSVE